MTTGSVCAIIFASVLGLAGCDAASASRAPSAFQIKIPPAPWARWLPYAFWSDAKVFATLAECDQLRREISQDVAILARDLETWRRKGTPAERAPMDQFEQWVHETTGVSMARFSATAPYARCIALR
jgi:hypothetical protein